MARLIELVKQSAVPANVMRSAARGALALPPGEMIEILVYLTANPVFAETTRMTLAAWDEKASIEVCKDPNTPWEVLEYWIAPQNRRPKLVPALLENTTLREARLIDFANENITVYADADIGAAARLVHEGCARVLREHFTIEPVRGELEGTRITLPEGFDAASVRLTGNVVGKAPFTGTLSHRGWRARDVRLPQLADKHDASIIAPAEVEL